MKVKDLINELRKHDPEAEVIMYHNTEECDGVVDYTEAVNNVDEDTLDKHYCKGFSVVEDNYISKNIVYLIGG